MLLTKAEATARSILKGFGINSVETLASLALRDLIQARGAFYEEIPLEGMDGRIVTHQGRSIVSVNKSITDTGKKRFAAAHELGHFELHKDLAVSADTQYELCSWFQSGQKEKEANDFASELLMPSKLFQSLCSGRKFGPKLIETISEAFVVSRTAAILKFVKSGNHPVCVICSQDNKVKWWKMSQHMETADHAFVAGWLRYKLKIASNLPPPLDSVAGQVFKARTSQSIERYQEIEKSTWFLTHPNDDPKMFEYCNFVPGYNFALSVIWED